MTIELEQFGGLAPLVSPLNLAANYATRSVNARFNRGVISSVRRPARLTPPALFPTEGVDGIVDFYPHDGGYLTSTTPASYVDSPFANDSANRVYFTDGEFPKFHSAGTDYRLGLPVSIEADLDAVTVVPDTPLPANDPNAETVLYTYVYVDSFGHEGAPGGVTTSVSYQIGTDITVGNLPTTAPVAPDGNPYNVAFLRLYRSNQGSELNNFQFLADIPLGTATYVDQVLSGSLGEVIPSIDWIEPPNDDVTLYPDGPLQGLVALGNGVLAGYSGNTVAVSEPFFPNAWPARYRFSIPEEVRGVAPVAQGAVVVTDGRPYYLTGSTPEGMALVPIDASFACLNPRSLVPMGDFAFWISSSGIVASTGPDVQLVTDALFDRETWQAMPGEINNQLDAPLVTGTFDLSDIQCFRHDNRYIGAWPGGGFEFTPSRERPDFTYISLAQPKAGHYDLERDQLIILQGSSFPGFGQLADWDRGPQLEYIWESKPFEFPNDRAYSTLRCIFRNQPLEALQDESAPINGTPIYTDPVARVTCELTNCDETYWTKELVEKRNIQRLPHKYLEELKILFRGTGHVSYVKLSSGEHDASL